MNTFVQQEWTDSRLNFHGFIEAEYLELDANLIKSIWVPDLYFTNEKVASFHDVTVPNKMLHLFSNGRIVYRLRYEFLMSLLEHLCIDYFCLQKNLLINNCEDLHKTNKRSYNS